ncbi:MULTISPECIES: chemotaxis protein CheW [unclassified Methanoculleus]|uniref:hybrid sensor histidine kinase/response regulator n=1 Tax=unclassified Methanoculleus TaxID=2619537 RepID=UPI0025DB4120|nr:MULTISPECIES: chemotaxis protein CheW [unclassified Methanoculleus]MCK9317399.1 response regulator [Methanoculleus sp.]MDD2253469.1 response regulator [Methanoculleus sp.]MDD2787525.1 response regulator [Methanoculleus sp.]MDD3215415.1 response regulator [Methanoculleus sp.]MDD4314261.1 response regulator [Methanoculleus sp.]
MTGSDEAFRARLLETFREEADEYLEAITGGLLELEKGGLEPELVESVYRRIHSLKGAARAVNLREIESVCQNLETVSSLVKRGEYTPGEDDFDLFHRTLAVVKALLRGERPDASPAEIIGALRALPEGKKSAGDEKPVGDGRRDEPGPAPGENRAPGTAESRNGGETTLPGSDGGTVRVAAHKLDRLTAGADSLLTTQLFITQRIRDLEEMMTRFTLWQWNHSQAFNDLHLIRRRAFGEERAAIPPDLILPLQRAVEFQEYNREFVANLQHDLAMHLRAMEMDQTALKASISEISDLVHDAALLPASSMLAPFSAFVREFSRTSGKSVDLTIEGGEIEVDRRILDALKEPVTHLIRNSIDHGIEDPETRLARKKPASGTVRIRVFPRSGSRVGIEVADDGAGIDSSAIRRTALENGVITMDEDAALTDSEAIWLIFKSGMTTSRIVTDLSGRGLGLAIVEDAVSRLGGEVTVSSTPGRGTTITFFVPVRMTTLRGLLVRSERQVYVLPIQQVKQVLRVRPDSLAISRSRPTIRVSGETIEVIRLTDALGVPAAGPAPEKGRPTPLVIIAYGAGQIACMVDEVIRVQEIVVRPLGSQLRSVRRIEGAVILGDGSVALVLDPLELIQDAMQADRPAPAPRLPGETGQRILVVEDSITSRVLLQTVLERAGYRVETAADGVDALARFKQHEFDMLVSDVDMPRMNGFSLIEKIRAEARQTADLRVVVVTSLDSPEDREQGKAVGVDAYIVKSSFETKGFLETIRRLMHRR